MLSPICLFTYNRLAETQQTIAALKNNHLAPNSKLYIFSDGPKKETEIEKVEKVRDFIKTVNGFKSVEIFNSEKNQGLASSIIQGVSKIIKNKNKVIVLEDDLITAPNFLVFMNQALDYYLYKDRIFSISGFSHKVTLDEKYKYDVFLRGRPYSWGWATWKDRWESVDWDVNDWESFKNNKLEKKEFNSHGSDLFGLLESSMNGKISSWAIRFAYSQYKQRKFTICPTLSKIRNDGFNDNATNCKTTYNRHKILFDLTQKYSFNFTDDLTLNPFINAQLVAYNNISSRIKSKIFTQLIKNKIIKNKSEVEYIKKTINK